MGGKKKTRRDREMGKKRKRKKEGKKGKDIKVEFGRVRMNGVWRK